MGTLDGKVVIVTGASSGIGASCVEVMAAEGAKVVGGARRKDRLDELAAKCGPNVLPVVTDVKKEARYPQPVRRLRQDVRRAAYPRQLRRFCPAQADYRHVFG